MQHWTEGETLPRLFTLLNGDTPQDLTACTVELILTDLNGTVISTSGDVAITGTPTNGQVTFSPDASDLLSSGSPFTAMFRVTNTLAQVGYFPSSGPDVWTVSLPTTSNPAHTFLDLRTSVLRWLDALDDLNTGNVLDELVKQQLNDAHQARVAEYPWSWLRVTAQVAVTPSTLRYALAGNLQRLLYLWSAVDKQHCTRIPDRMWADLQLGMNASHQSGSIYQPYTLEGTTLRFLEPPRQGETLHYGYFRMPSVLVNDQDIPDLPFPHSRLLVWDALLDLKSYAKDLDGVALWTKKQDKAVQDLFASQVEGQTLNEFPQFVHVSPTA